MAFFLELFCPKVSEFEVSIIHSEFISYIIPLSVS